MLKWFRRLWTDKRGNAIVIATAFLPVLIGSAGLATDTIQWALWKRQLQRSADSAAIAGVYDRVQNDGSTGQTGSAVTKDLSLNQHTGLALLASYPKVSFPGDDANGTNQVKVELAVKKRLAFSGMFMEAAPEIKAAATAAAVTSEMEVCMLGLEKRASKSGIIIAGNAGVSSDCSLFSNSESTNQSIDKNGNPFVGAPSMGAVGAIQKSDSWDVDSYYPYSPPIDDPFKDVNPSPSEMKCAGHNQGNGSNAKWVSDVLNENTDFNNSLDASGDKANCYSSLSVGAGKTLALPPGTYYINGGDAFIQGSLSCTACTIVLTNSSGSPDATIGTFKVNSTATVNMSAPTTGTYAGISIFQDRRAKDSSSANNLINGNSSSAINGSIYFPNQELIYNGTGNTAAVCTMFIAKRLIFSGDSGTTNKFKKASECDAYKLPVITTQLRVRLVA
ncbi:MAG: Tad domain-containing protein [Sphingomicrobium sp.]